MFKIIVNPGNLTDVIGAAIITIADLPTFIAKAFSHRNPEVTSVDELYFLFSFGGFPIGDNPNISRDACVVKELLW